VHLPLGTADWQARAARPFIFTVHVPQLPALQPYEILALAAEATTLIFCPTTAFTGFPLTVTLSLLFGPFDSPAFWAGLMASSLANAFLKALPNIPKDVVDKPFVAGHDGNTAKDVINDMCDKQTRMEIANFNDGILLS